MAILLFAAIAPARAQQEPVTNPDYWRNYPRGIAGIVTAPARWDSDQWQTVAVIAGVTGGLFLADEEIRHWWQEDVRGGATDTLADIGRPFGSNAGVALGSAALYGTGLLLDNTRLRETGLLTLQGMVLSNITLEAVKLLAHRHRPDESPQDAHQWDGPGTGGSNKSFASGHAAKAFVAAGILASQYPENGALQATAYGIAGLTAFSRVNDDRHWASDVVAGAAIGYGIGKLVSAMSPFADDSRVSLSPVTPDGSLGMTFIYQF